jgi:two-component system LytT family sensor kinase
MNLLGRPLKTAAAILAGWTFFHLFFLTEAAIRSDERRIPLVFDQVVIANALTVIIWMLLTPFFVYAVSRIDLPRNWTLGRTLLVIVAVIIFAMTRSIIGGAAGLAIEGTPLIPQELWKAFVARMFGNTFAAACCAALLLLIDYRGAAREREQLNAKLTEANLAQLKAQLRPHFLFNTLNTIATLVHTDPKTADKMIT